MPDSATINVQVLFAWPDQQHLLSLQVPVGCTLGDAIDASGIRRHTGDFEINDQNVGIYSRPATLASVLNEGDRVEIYRPLTRDPKDMRRLRAKGQGKK